jgi:photosystem II stability/assembly factor-like uncharacterized protein
MYSTMVRGVLGFLTVTLAFTALHAQWQMQDSHSTSSLRGIHAVNNSVAWATGANGTILRTQDGGAHWQRCASPAGGEKLDFRGVWAWSANEATILSSGPGDLSRVYATSDGCAHWTEEARNSEKEGFWDVLMFPERNFDPPRDKYAGTLIGDPIQGKFAMQDGGLGHRWLVSDHACAAKDGEAAFAASNSAAYVFGLRQYIVVTGGKGGPRALLSPLLAHDDSKRECLAVELPLAGGSDSGGAFSVAFRDLTNGVVVGGDYKKPDDATGTAAWSADGGRHWTAASKPPHGYRSAVAWYPQANAWIAVGTNGSDVSRDDGKTWERLDDGKWNALSLPFVVGPNGRIGRLCADSLKAKSH